MEIMECEAELASARARADEMEKRLFVLRPKVFACIQTHSVFDRRVVVMRTALRKLEERCGDMRAVLEELSLAIEQEKTKHAG